MNQDKQNLYDQIDQKLKDYKTRKLPGITNPNARHCLILQIVDSIRRIEYVKVIKNKDLSLSAKNPHKEGFNPLKAASWNKQNGEIDEAFWLIFLLTHFGKNLKTKWNLVQDVYGKLGDNPYWTWNNISLNPIAFKYWLNNNLDAIKANGKVGNHRKYQSLHPYSPSGTGVAIESYVDWVGPSRSHQNLITNAKTQVGNNPRDLFKYLYLSMNEVVSFGRTARFDYLTMIGKLGLANIEPDSTYMQGATGPFKGANILFGSNETRAKINEWLSDLESHLGLYFGMQVLEDSICNWQKDTQNYKYFGG